MVSVSWKGLQGVFLYDKTEMLKHLDSFIPATYEPCTTNTQTKYVRAAVATTKFHSSPLSPSLLIPPQASPPTQAAGNAAHGTAVPEAAACRRSNIIWLQAQMSSSQLPSYRKRWNYLMLSGQLSHLLFFKLQTETAIDTFSRTKLNFGRGQNEAACFDFLSAYLTVPA